MATSIKAVIAAAEKYAYHWYGQDHEDQVILVLEGKMGRVQYDLLDMTPDKTPGLFAWHAITDEVLRGELGKDIARICATV